MVEVHDENHATKKRPIIFFFPDDFGLRSPVIQTNISDENCYLYPSMYQRPSSSEEPLIFFGAALAVSRIFARAVSWLEPPPSYWLASQLTDFSRLLIVDLRCFASQLTLVDYWLPLTLVD